MTYLIKLSRAIDKLNNWLGQQVSWLILIAVLLSAGNALVRYAIGDSSNAFLELQWVLIAAVFLIGAGYTLLHQQHVKVDIVYARFSRRTQLWIDIFGTVFFLFPMAFIVMWLSWPVFVTAYQSGEVSTNTGGLTIWWARLLVPVGFFLLLLQGLSELIKRIAILRGDIDDTLAAESTQPQQHQQP
jgi:TRAP-type mannitol/chloroaromatic compound transport system permease small subunit